MPPPPSFLGAAPAGRRTPSGRRWWIAGGVAAALALAAGVSVALLAGGDQEPEGDAFAGQSPADIVRAAERDMAVVETARIRGEFDDDGDTLTVDVTATSRGDCRGTMSSAESGGTAEILRVDDQFYLRADRAFWTASAGDDTSTTLLLALIGDKWVKENSLLESTEAFCDLDEFLERDGREDAETIRLGAGEVGGEETVRIEQKEGSSREVLDIRVAEPHYLMGVEESEVDSFEFSDFDEDAEITAPADDEIIPIREILDFLDDGLAGLPGAEGSASPSP